MTEARKLGPALLPKHSQQEALVKIKLKQRIAEVERLKREGGMKEAEEKQKVLTSVLQMGAEDYEVFENLQLGPHAGEEARDLQPDADNHMPSGACKLYDGKPCFQRFNIEKMLDFRLTGTGLPRESLDASILGCIAAGQHQMTRKPAAEKMREYRARMSDQKREDIKRKNRAQQEKSRSKWSQERKEPMPRTKLILNNILPLIM
ncbi:hypothetical protein ElyMa_004544700 [Elysia marginata]|uniref:Coiled-coil domain-containing protein 137 n=1 Tax=Elysia marginata TaxID=1093978 RepID=A0AAV4HTI3_9GAST|nr:hypothetical protein ElyMa_004544700 [Elysia marginata]